MIWVLMASKDMINCSLNFTHGKFINYHFSDVHPDLRLGKYMSTVQHILARLIWSKSSTLPIVLSPIFLHFLLNYVILSQKIYGGT